MKGTVWSLICFIAFTHTIEAKTLCPGESLEQDANLKSLEKLSVAIESLTFPEEETVALCELSCWEDGKELDEFIKYYMRNIPGDDEFRVKKFYKEIVYKVTCPPSYNVIGPSKKMCTNEKPERLTRLAVIYRSTDLIEHYYQKGVNYNMKDPNDGMDMVQWAKKLCDTEKVDYLKTYYCNRAKRIGELASISEKL
jgi:hypothetical protein